jgi:hypothetical protein
VRPPARLGAGPHAHGLFDHPQIETHPRRHETGVLGPGDVVGDLGDTWRDRLQGPGPRLGLGEVMGGELVLDGRLQQRLGLGDRLVEFGESPLLDHVGRVDTLGISATRRSRSRRTGMSRSSPRRAARLPAASASKASTMRSVNRRSSSKWSSPRAVPFVATATGTPLRCSEMTSV